MARFDDPQFIIDQNLDPAEWHVVGVPAAKPDPNTQKPPTTRTENTDFTLTLAGPNGVTRTVTMRPTGPGVSATNVGLNQLDWNVTGVEEGVKPPTGTGVSPQTADEKAKAETAQATAAAAASAQALKDLQDDNNKRQGNLSSRGLFMTDKEIADMDKSLRDQGLQQQQIDAQLKIASDNNANSRIANEISATNAKTSSFVAQKNAEIAEARLALDKTGLDLQAQRDAYQEFQNAWTRGHAEITDAQAQSRIDLDRLTQQQTNQIATGQLGATQQANVLRGQELAQKTAQDAAALEQRRAEAAQTATTAERTAATGAAATTYGNELQAQTAAGTVGGNLLSNRATAANNLISNILSGVGGMSQGSSGRYGMLGGGLQSMPAGFSGEALVGGAYGVTGAAFGGQDTLDAAARMVRNAAPGSELTPMGQAAVGVLHQVFDHIKSLGGNVPSVGTAGPGGAVGAPNTAVGAGTGAPLTVGVAQPQAQQQQAVVAAPVTLPQPFVQSGLPEGSARGMFPITAPPTVLVNI